MIPALLILVAFFLAANLFFLARLPKDPLATSNMNKRIEHCLGLLQVEIRATEARVAEHEENYNRMVERVAGLEERVFLLKTSSRP